MDNPFKLLKRRDGWHYHYLLTFVDGANVALIEQDLGFPNAYAKREPTRRLCVANVSHLEELQDLCDDWNAENKKDLERDRLKNPYHFFCS